MLKRLVNELRCRLTLTATGPLLVKSGHASVTGPDMTPVRTYRNGAWQVYLPGSSLKGVLRSHLEKVCRSLRPGVVCNPFVRTSDQARAQGQQLLCPEFSEVACSDKFEVREKGKLRLRDNTTWSRLPEPLEDASAIVYADSCPICRLFGSTSFIGRLSIGDAYLVTPERVEKRDGIGIDRLTGGTAHGAKFELEAVSPGVSFQAEIQLRNFECWHVGLLAVAVADLRDQLVRIGSGRSRGLGAVQGELAELTIATLAPTPGRGAGTLWGLGEFQTGAERQAYGTFAGDQLQLTPPPAESKLGLRQVAIITGPSLAALEGGARDELVRRLDAWQVPARMQWRGDWGRK